MSIDVNRPVNGSATVRVAARVRAVIAYYGLTQTEVARKLGKNAQWMSVRMRGEQPISLADLELIAEVLDVETAELVPPRKTQHTARVLPDTFAYPASSPLPHLRTSGRPVGHPGGSRGPSGGRRATTGPPSQTVGRFAGRAVPVGGL